jgi:Flp pilus assembly protein CpaB
MKRRSGCIWIAAGAVLALVAGLLAFLAILRASSTAVPAQPKAPTVGVVVAARALVVRELIEPGSVELRPAPADIVPETALRRVGGAVGWMTIVPLAPGEMILSSQIISPTVKGEHFAFTMDPAKVAMAFPANDLMSSNNLLQSGDHVDMLFSIQVEARDQQTGALVTFNALQNLEIALIVRPRNIESGATQQGTAADLRPLAIVFALDPQDALVLKHLQDMGGTVDIVLRAPGAKELFETQPVHLDYILDRYTIRFPVEP